MVKICGITRRQDAEAVAAAGAYAIGFVLYSGSPRCISPEAAAELGRDLNMLKVGVFVDETGASIEALMRAAALDIAQVYGGDAPPARRVWRAFRVNQGIDAALTEGAEALLLDGPANGIPFDWTRARGAAPKIIVAGGLDAANVAEAIRTARPWGVDASSRLESAPGVKDHEKIRQFVRAAREATP